jgi:sec-independent protein translocase protein TatA
MNPTCHTVLALLGLDPREWVLIFAMGLVLLGAKKIPDIARGLGDGMREFKKAIRNPESGVGQALKDGDISSGVIGEALTTTNHTVDL